MYPKQLLTQPGVVAALLAALLFGAGTPLAKLLFAGLLYQGSGLGLTLVRRHPRTHAPITHSYVHFPYVHHRHRHS